MRIVLHMERAPVLSPAWFRMGHRLRRARRDSAPGFDPEAFNAKVRALQDELLERT